MSITFKKSITMAGKYESFYSVRSFNKISNYKIIVLLCYKSIAAINGNFMKCVMQQINECGLIS